VTLFCTTPGATIFYQVVNKGGSPGGTWTTFAGGTFLVSGSKRLFTYATASGFVDSGKVTRDY